MTVMSTMGAEKVVEAGATASEEFITQAKNTY
jgi:hypothetical protein